MNEKVLQIVFDNSKLIFRKNDARDIETILKNSSSHEGGLAFEAGGVYYDINLEKVLYWTVEEKD